MSLTSLKTILPASLTESGGKLGLMLLRHLHSCLWSSQASFYFFLRKRKKKNMLFSKTYTLFYVLLYMHTRTYTGTAISMVSLASGRTRDTEPEQHQGQSGWGRNPPSAPTGRKEAALPQVLTPTELAAATTGNISCWLPKKQQHTWRTKTA